MSERWAGMLRMPLGKLKRDLQNSSGLEAALPSLKHAPPFDGRHRIVHHRDTETQSLRAVRDSKSNPEVTEASEITEIAVPRTSGLSRLTELGIKLNWGFRMDLLVETVDRLLTIHFAQSLTYLKLSGKRLKEGLRRLTTAPTGAPEVSSVASVSSVLSAFDFDFPFFKTLCLCASVVNNCMRTIQRWACSRACPTRFRVMGGACFSLPSRC